MRENTNILSSKTLPELKEREGESKKLSRQLDVYPKAIKRRHMDDVPITFGLSADRPTSGADSAIFAWFSTDTGVLSLWNGSSWLTTTLT